MNKCALSEKFPPTGNFFQELTLEDLPKERVIKSYIFNSSGVDFTGSFLIQYEYQCKGIYHNENVAIFIFI